MAYDLTSLTTWAMCDRAKALADAVHDDITYQLSQVGRHNKIATTASENTEANLDATSLEVTALTASLANLAPGPVREKYERKLRRATERQSQLTDRAGDFDGVVLTDNEFDKRRLTGSLAETTTYLTELAAHRATLAS